MSKAKISDTARVVAFARAVESEHSGALFNDPFARSLAGDIGERLARKMGDVESISRALAVRTAVIDDLLLDRIEQQKIDQVLNIGAGLDTRPWRLSLPSTLQWIDADLPDILSYKHSHLNRQSATCEYLFLSTDITQPSELSSLLSHTRSARCALVLTEGLLVYMLPSQVAFLAAELLKCACINSWITDITGPRALQMMRSLWSPLLGNASFEFGPLDSEEFFRQLGWSEIVFRSSAEEARRMRRVAAATWFSRLVLSLASRQMRDEFRRLSGVILMSRTLPEIT